jgi:hypothetical protein
MELVISSLSATQTGRGSTSSLIRYALEFCGVFHPSAIANPLTFPSPPGRAIDVSTQSGRASATRLSGRGDVVTTASSITPPLRLKRAGGSKETENPQAANC